MAVARRPPRRRAPTSSEPDQLRYTIDASVFVNAFNPHEEGHAESLAVVTTIQERGPLLSPVTTNSVHAEPPSSPVGRRRRQSPVD